MVGQREGGLIRLSSRGGPPSPLTQLDRSRQEVGHGGPRFLPDGRHFIYSRASSVRANIGLYVGLVDARPDDQPSQPILLTDSRPAYAASTDGRLGHLLVVRDGVLLAYPFDERRLVVTGDPAPIAEGVGTGENGNVYIALVSASANGVLAYRNTAAVIGTPTWVDRNGRVLGNLVNEPLAAPEYPRLSPDGRRIALVVGGDLWVYRTDGRPAIKLTSSGRVAQPLWTPDGGWILYMDTAGNQLRTVPSDRVAMPDAASPPGIFLPYGWTRDGRVLAAAFSLSTVSGGTVNDVDIVSFKPDPTAVLRPVIKTPATEGGRGLALSPDGRWLAYTSAVTGRDEIWVQRLGKTERPPVRVSPAGGVQPRWAPSGELYYLESNRMMTVPLKPGSTFDFGPPQVLFENAYLTAGVAPYDVGPDGSFLIIANGPIAGRSPLNVVVNWTGLLTVRKPPL